MAVINIDVTTSPSRSCCYSKTEESYTRELLYKWVQSVQYINIEKYLKYKSIGYSKEANEIIIDLIYFYLIVMYYLLNYDYNPSCEINKIDNECFNDMLFCLGVDTTCLSEILK